jgi:hypothetical protein
MPVVRARPRDDGGVISRREHHKDGGFAIVGRSEGGGLDLGGIGRIVPVIVAAQERAIPVVELEVFRDTCYVIRSSVTPSPGVGYFWWKSPGVPLRSTPRCNPSRLSALCADLQTGRWKLTLRSTPRCNPSRLRRFTPSPGRGVGTKARSGAQRNSGTVPQPIPTPIRVAESGFAARSGHGLSAHVPA